MLLKAQKKASKELKDKLSKYKIACLWGEARSGKSRSFLDASRGYKTLVITEKSAIDGVLSEAKEIGIKVDVINYQSAHKITSDYELYICDESHRFISQSTPKPPIIWRNIVKLTRGIDKLLILASATPTSEGFGGLYYKLKLSLYTPFKYPRFTKFFEDYGIPSKIYTGTRLVESYKKTKIDKIQKAMSHLVVTLTRRDTGHKFESEDIIHNISLSKQQKKIIKKLTKKDLYIKKEFEILGDTPVKKLIKLHQIVGGIGVKCENESIFYLKKHPKVAYIHKNFNVNKTIILAYYKHEQEFLARLFPHTGSITKLSTGVDLSHYDSMIIFSMAFSSANYFQVKARLMNVNRKTQMKVHYLISGIDKYVLEAVQSKKNFTIRWFKNA